MFSQLSIMIIFCPVIRQCPLLEHLVTTLFGQFQQTEILLLVHGTSQMQPDELENLFLWGKLWQIFDLVACFVFSLRVVDKN